MVFIFLKLFSILSLSGGLVYYFYRLNSIGLFLSIAITALLSLVLIPYFKISRTGRTSGNTPFWKRPSAIFVFLSLAYLIFTVLAFYTLFFSATAKAIISPWQVIPVWFFLLYFTASFLLFFISHAGKSRFEKNLLRVFIPLHYFLSFSAALFVYKIGYGFDPFIHESAMKVIDAKGLIEPKTFYYSGFYGLAIILHKILFIPLAWLNKFLVPVLGAFLIPPIMARVFKSLGWDEFSASALAIVLLIFPFSFLIMTTPQNLAFLLVFIIIALSLAAKKMKEYVFLFLMALAIFTIHPLAGIPAILFSLLLLIYYNDHEPGLASAFSSPALKKLAFLKKYLYFGYYALCSTALPLAFYIFEKGNGEPRQSPAESFPGFSSLIQSLKIILPNKENLFLNFSYLIQSNGIKIILILALIGIIIALKSNWKKYKIYAYSSLAFFVSYFLTEGLSFSYLINYERSAYSDRILFLALLFLFPFILLVLKWYLEKLFIQKGLILFSSGALLAVLMTASLYISYPRYDAYFNSRGLSTGNFDIEAVRWMEEDAGGEYIALANQQVSAAALHEFGFKHYLKAKTGEEIFNYPIPTGGPLYQYYLAMVYDKPTRTRMEKAMNLTSAKTGYFVLNKYWFQYPKILEEAKLSASSWKSFGDGEVVVFKYIVE
ncbi:MAG: hypothetical protein WCW77_00060 [Patescibacteria group bacterium]|jgi:hypothetical protein